MARIRGLTYQTELYCGVEIKKLTYGEENRFTGVRAVTKEETKFSSERVLIGKIPVMVRSRFCHLSNLTKEQIVKDARECRYDQGGYFIINGNEKVLVAQERMAANIVLVFHKPGFKYNWVAEIRSAHEASGRPPQQFCVKLRSKSKSGANESGQTIWAQIPMIKEDIPIVILLRALNVIGDKQIQDLIIYDKSDTDMVDMLRASLEQAESTRTQEEALDFIAKKSNSYDRPKDLRIKIAMNLLEENFLPHISTTADGQLKKAYFVGYMVNRLLTGSLGRATEDDRDYYGKKRMDMAGFLLATLFRSLFHQFVIDMIASIKKQLDSNKRCLDLLMAIKPDKISGGLKQALSTGNWGRDKENNVLKTGVSQVLNRLTFASSLSHMRRLTTPLSK